MDAKPPIRFVTGSEATGGRGVSADTGASQALDDVLIGLLPVGAAAPIDDVPVDLTAFMPLVRSIAYRIHASIPLYAAVELSDLLQSGHLGLVHAGKAYQKSRRVPFPVYARFRIRGEILDALRRLDFASRGMRRADKLLRAIQDASNAESEQPPVLAAGSDTLHGTPIEHRGHLNPARFIRLPAVAITSLDEQRTEAANWRTSSPGPDKIHSASEARTHLDEAVRTLPPRSQELIRFYYQGGLTMREIGEHFHIKESRVSQLHRRALNSMARHLRAAGIGSAAEVCELEG
jgi:RNA polymerase sigma factor for flagellar operon FliA